MHPKYLSINDYDYSLPQDKIALFPLAERDASRLLHYSGKKIEEYIFKDLPDLLSRDTLLIFNDSRVIPARLIFQKETGGKIEIFCLEPINVVADMDAAGSREWRCMVGGASRWKQRYLHKKIRIGEDDVILKVELLEKSAPYSVKFHWEPAGYSFQEIMEAAGQVPLPPYIKRETEESDKERYQTVYATNAGSVAAPTAGLHFTEGVMNRLKEKAIEIEYLTLHVGAGTFKPVDAEKMEGHQMHAEWIDVKASTIEKLIAHQGPLAAVGTTSTRTLESLYWLGEKIRQGSSLEGIGLNQWEVYEEPLAGTESSKTEALQALHHEMQRRGKKSLICQTSLLIAPGYKYRVIDRIITNFHQPKSTLLLLVAAAAGKDWKKIYDYALENNFRFLSYGDSSLIDINSEW